MAQAVKGGPLTGLTTLTDDSPLGKLLRRLVTAPALSPSPLSAPAAELPPVAELTERPSGAERRLDRDVAYAALFPVRLDAQVRTPQGCGRLLQVFRNRVMVHLNGRKGATFFVPEEVGYVAEAERECP